MSYCLSTIFCFNYLRVSSGRTPPKRRKKRTFYPKRRTKRGHFFLQLDCSSGKCRSEVSSSSKIEMTKLVSRSMSKKQHFGNLNLSAANLPSFEDESESDDKQEGNNDESTEPKHQLKSPSSRKKIGEK